MSNINPTTCLRCAFRRATRHVYDERICNECLDGREKLEIAQWPVNVHDNNQGDTQ